MDPDSSVHHHEPPQGLASPLDLSHHFSRATKSRKRSPGSAFDRLSRTPNIANLADGVPSSSLFAFDTLEAQVARPNRWPITSTRAADHSTGSSLASLTDRLPSVSFLDSLETPYVSIPRKASQTVPSQKIDLETALRYDSPNGYPPLLSFVRQFTKDVLHPDLPYVDGPEVIMTCGSMDGFSKTLSLLVDHWYPERDNISDRPGMLCEAFISNNIIINMASTGAQVVPVEMDEQGMLATGQKGLGNILEGWDPGKGRRPHVLYTQTVGNNSEIGLLTLERKQQIYDICCRFDIIIIEDDPCWFLQYPSAALAEAGSRGLLQSSSRSAVSNASTVPSGYEFIDSLTPSYLHFDTHGRVVRLDTFSNVIAPGCGLGWITAQPVFIERLERITEASTHHPSGFVQSMVAQMILGTEADSKLTISSLLPKDWQRSPGWTVDGWIRWLAGLQGEYERRMCRACKILDDNLYQLKQSRPVNDPDDDWGVISKARILSFSWPRGGMFVWVRLHFESHSLWQKRGRKVPLLDGPSFATALLVLLAQAPNLVFPAPGSRFCPTPVTTEDRAWAYMRLSFVAEEDGNLEDGFRRFGNGLQRFWRIKSVDHVEQLIEEFSRSDAGT